MRRVVPRSNLRSLVRTSRRSSRRRAGAASQAVRCPLAQLLSPRLDVTKHPDAEATVYRARLAVTEATIEAADQLANAFLNLVVCAATTSTAEPGELRQAIWTDRSGNMTLELRSHLPGVSTKRLAQMVRPVLTGYAAGALAAARLVAGREDVRMTVDVSKRALADGGVVVRVVLHGPASVHAQPVREAPASGPRLVLGRRVMANREAGRVVAA